MDQFSTISLVLAPAVERGKALALLLHRMKFSVLAQQIGFRNAWLPIDLGSQFVALRPRMAFKQRVAKGQRIGLLQYRDELSFARVTGLDRRATAPEQPLFAAQHGL